MMVSDFGHLDVSVNHPPGRFTRCEERYNHLQLRASI
jgi:hypothetical protein